MKIELARKLHASKIYLKKRIDFLQNFVSKRSECIKHELRSESCKKSYLTERIRHTISGITMNIQGQI